jgi:hypothetical protein
MTAGVEKSPTDTTKIAHYERTENRLNIINPVCLVAVIMKWNGRFVEGS